VRYLLVLPLAAVGLSLLVAGVSVLVLVAWLREPPRQDKKPSYWEFLGKT
jgi:hypothetical protein